MKWLFLFGFLFILPFSFSEVMAFDLSTIPNWAWWNLAYIIIGVPSWPTYSMHGPWIMPARPLSGFISISNPSSQRYLVYCWTRTRSPWVRQLRGCWFLRGFIWFPSGGKENLVSKSKFSIKIIVIPPGLCNRGNPFSIKNRSPWSLKMCSAHFSSIEMMFWHALPPPLFPAWKCFLHRWPSKSHINWTDTEITG